MEFKSNIMLKGSPKRRPSALVIKQDAMMIMALRKIFDGTPIITMIEKEITEKWGEDV